MATSFSHARSAAGSSPAIVALLKDGNALDGKASVGIDALRDLARGHEGVAVGVHHIRTAGAAEFAAPLLAAGAAVVAARRTA